MYMFMIDYVRDCVSTYNVCIILLSLSLSLSPPLSLSLSISFSTFLTP